MEKTFAPIKEDILRSVAQNPATAYTFMLSLTAALGLAHEILHDLTWERGGRLEPLHEEYVVALNKIIREILERTDD